MTEIIGICFKSGGKQYYFDPNGMQFAVGADVIVDTSRGLEYGQCVQSNTLLEDDAVIQPLRPAIRAATEEDQRTAARNREKEEKAFVICQEKIAAHGLEMKLVDAEYSFEGNKVLFFFTAEGRVDFRALVKDLAGAIHARIELRQIGVRDEAKMLGGLGICGRPFCCSQFLEEFQPVSIKMAKTQNLSLNPTKISGTCGRLMCCLKYEQNAYEDLVKHTPKPDSFVETPDGAGTVSSVSLLRQRVQVRLDSAPEAPKCYQNCELCVVRQGKGKRPDGYVEPPLSELAKLRCQPETEPAPTPAAQTPLSAALETVFQNGQRPPEPVPGDTRRRPRPESPAREGAAPARPQTDRPRRTEKPRQPVQPGPNRAAQPVQSPGTAGESEKKPNRRRRRPGRAGEGSKPFPPQPNE